MKTTPGSSWNVFPFEEQTSHTFFDTHSQNSIFICVIIFLSDVTVQESKLSIFRAVSLSLSWKIERLVLRKMVFQKAAKSRITEYLDLLRQCYFKFNDSQHSVCSPLDLYFNIKTSSWDRFCLFGSFLHIILELPQWELWVIFHDMTVSE